MGETAEFARNLCVTNGASRAAENGAAGTRGLASNVRNGTGLVACNQANPSMCAGNGTMSW